MLAGGKGIFSEFSITFTMCVFLAFKAVLYFYGYGSLCNQCRDPMNNNKDCRVGQLTNALSTFQEELDMSRLQVKQLNDLVTEADEIVKVLNQDATTLTLNLLQKSDHMQDKEREVVQLSELVDRDRMLIKVAVFLIYMDFFKKGAFPERLVQKY